MESYIIQLDFSAAFYRVSYSGLLFKLRSIGVGRIAVCCPFVGSSSPTAFSKSWLMVVLVSRSQSFLAWPKEVCWVPFCLSFIPVKCLSWWQTDYMPMLMTPHYQKLFTSQQTNLLLLLLLTGTLLGFSSFAITGEWYWILTKLRL